MTERRSPIEATASLRAFLDASPTPWHAVDAAVQILTGAGFVDRDRNAPEIGDTRGYFLRREGSLVAWQAGTGVDATTPVRIAAAHTDSPGFRVKPRPESVSAGCVRLGVEVYGGPLVNSWLDRDLGLAGTVLVGHGDGLTVRPVIDPNPVVRIPQLAIHLDREVNTKGLKLDRQQHLPLLWGLGDRADSFVAYVAELADVPPDAVRGFDLAPFDLTPARVCGRHSELLASARLDDLLSCHAALEGLVDAKAGDEVIAVVALVDHEEVGSTSATGANGRFLDLVLARITADLDAGRNDVGALADGSHALSLDMAHATHPGYPERHDPVHPVRLDGGPVIKHNAQQRYATSLGSMAPFLAACDAVSVEVQEFVSHSEMPCGSTIGPSLAASLAIPVVDVGVAQMAMHSTREVCGSADHDRLRRALTWYLSHA